MAGDMDRREYDDLISRLGKRVFVLRNVHDKHPSLFQTRWAMNYLAGPLTRTQIPALNDLVGAASVAKASEPAGTTVHADQAVAATTGPSAPDIELDGTETRPQVPTRIAEFFLPNNLTLSEAANRMRRSLSADARSLGILYRPALLAQAEVRFTKPKYELDTELLRAALVEEPPPQGRVLWEGYEISPLEERALDRGPIAGARFAALSAPLNDARLIRDMETDFEDWLYRTCEVRIRANENLDVYAAPDVDEASFRRMCEDASKAERDAELDKVRAQYERKIETIEDRLRREEQELRRDEADLAARRREEAGKAVETLLGLFGGRKRSISGSLSKRRMTQQARLDVEESEESITQYQQQIRELQQEQADAETSVAEKWEQIVAEVSEIGVTPYKKDILVTMFGVAWVPYHVVEGSGRIRELPAFGTEENGR
jgi:hypothetical protein